jgi:hypothetical protein
VHRTVATTAAPETESCRGWPPSVAAAPGGVDSSIFIGLPAAGIVYRVLTRSLDLDLEFERAIKAEEGLLTGVH